MEHFEKEISLFIDNELPREERQRLFAHLAECNDCLNTFDAMSKLKNNIGKYYQGLVPESLPVLATPTGQKSRAAKIYKSKRNWYYAAAAVFILCCFSWVIYSRMEIELKYYTLKKELAMINNSSQVSRGKQPDVLASEKKDSSGFELKSIKKQKTKHTTSIISNSGLVSSIKSFHENNKIPGIVTVKLTRDDFIGERMVGN